jgi:hypothetical protein
MDLKFGLSPTGRREAEDIRDQTAEENIWI